VRGARNTPRSPTLTGAIAATRRNISPIPGGSSTCAGVKR
jgi:hypothetical protein